MNYFQGSTENPYHISIGAVVRNSEGKVCCHYFDSITLKGETFSDFVLLMRETMEPNETIEQCLNRGLMEEFGTEASMRSYIGSIISHFPAAPGSKIEIEKTTLYFLCDFQSIDESKRSDEDLEVGSTLLWLSPEELVSRMKEQGKRLGREDVDESKILERIKIM